MERSQQSIEVGAINTNDKETPVQFDKLVEQFKAQFYKDEYEIGEALLDHFENLLPLQKVLDREQNPIGSDNDEVKAFLESEEVKCIREDRELFHYFFEQIQPETPWTSYYDEPTRKIKYKYEDGLRLVSCLSEAVINSPLINVLSLFGEIDMFKDWFPNVTECKIVNQVTNYRGLFKCKQTMPWPVWPRDMIFKGTGMFDRKTKSCLLVVKSIDEDVPYFGVPAPKTEQGHVRLDIKRGYHYFQKISDTQTRYIALFNSDPKLTFMPNWFMNFMMTKVCYQMLEIIEKKSKQVPTNEYNQRILKRSDLYGKIQKYLDEIDEKEEAPLSVEEVQQKQ